MKHKTQQKSKTENKRSEAEIDFKNVYASNVTRYAHNDIIEKIIRNCKGVKRCNDNVNIMQKERNRKDLRIILGFKENDIYERKEYSVLKK